MSYLFADDENSVYLRPDLVDPLTRQVYEIKTAKETPGGALQLAEYIVELNAATPADGLGKWKPGTTYLPPPKLLNVYKQIDAVVEPPIDGVITYELEDYSSNGNGGSPSLIQVANVVTVGLAVAVAAALLTGEYGY